MISAQCETVKCKNCFKETLKIGCLETMEDKVCKERISDVIENFVNDKRRRYAKHIKMLRILSGHRVTNVTYCNWQLVFVGRLSCIVR